MHLLYNRDMNEVETTLRKPVPIEYRPGAGGKTFPYIPINAVRDRLNDAFGLGWAFTIQREYINENEVAVVARLSYRVDENWYHKDGFGGKLLKGLTLGDALKAASSIALKKAAELIGVAVPDPEDAASQEQLRVLYAALKRRFGTIEQSHVQLLKKAQSLPASEVAKIISAMAA